MKEPLYTTRDIARELARRYSTMTHDELDILESVLVPRKYVKGELVLKEGDICTSIIYIHKGLLREFYYKNKKEVTEYLAVEGTIMMSIESLFHEEPSKLQIEALENSIIYELPKKRLEEVGMHLREYQRLLKDLTVEYLYIHIMQCHLFQAFLRQLIDDGILQGLYL